MRNHVCAAAFLSLGLLLCIPATEQAQATTLNYHLSGVIDAVDAPLAGTFAAGQAISSDYSFDSTISALGGSDATTAVFNALLSLTISSGAFSASSSAAAEIQVGNNESEPNTRYSVVSRASDGLTGTAVGSYSVDTAIFRLDDSTATVFSGRNRTAADFAVQLFRRQFVLPLLQGRHGSAGVHLWSPDRAAGGATAGGASDVWRRPWPHRPAGAAAQQGPPNCTTGSLKVVSQRTARAALRGRSFYVS